MVLFILSLTINFSYAEENAIRIGGIKVKIGMDIDELRRILPAKYNMLSWDELVKKYNHINVTKNMHTIFSADHIVAEIYTAKNTIVSIDRHVGEYAGGEVLELGDSINSAIVAALENKSSGMALIEVKTVRSSTDSANSMSIDNVTMMIGKRAVVISVIRGTFDNKEIRSVLVHEVLGPVDFVEELLRKQPGYRTPEKSK
jgi:hypothetical protein